MAHRKARRGYGKKGGRNRKRISRYITIPRGGMRL